jgi:hypothetical protein
MPTKEYYRAWHEKLKENNPEKYKERIRQNTEAAKRRRQKLMEDPATAIATKHTTRGKNYGQSDI